MDHLPLPSQPTSEPGRVKYVCASDDPYDGGDFAAFPARAGAPELLTFTPGIPIEQSYGLISASAIADYAKTRGSTVDAERMREFEKVSVAWIFFGLLHKVLSPVGLYDAVDYIQIQQDTGDKWLHTRRLSEIVSRWHEAIGNPKLVLQQDFSTDARNSLILARRMLLALSNPLFAAFDRLIKFALIAISDVVEGMLIREFYSGLNLIAPVVTLRFDKVSRDRMLRHGWCPAEIASAECNTVLDVSAMWYAEHVQKSQQSISHGDCDEHTCRSVPTSLPKHTTEDCACEHIQAEMASIAACFDDNDYPVLDIQDEDSTLSINVHPSATLEDDVAYVAISHVWADGLGNEAGISLPSCQVRRLNNLVQDIRSHAFFRGRPPNEELIPHKKRLLLWCDTLCCPKEQGLGAQQDPKARSLKHMRDVYEKAEYVLVLDSDVACYNFAEIGVLEAAWRIMHAKWMTRLWTYQEAGLPKRLLIQYADAPKSIFPIMIELGRLYRTTQPRTRLYNNLCAHVVMLRNWLHSDVKPWVSNAAGGLAHRAVKVTSDEPLCIATVLGFDIARMTRAPLHKRMQVLWQMICGHDRGIKKPVIFNTLARMTEPGFRWAPSTFLQDLKRTRILDYVCIDDDDADSPAILLKHGLQVRCAGWRIRLARRPACIPEDWIKVSELQHTILPTRHVDGTWYNVMRTYPEGIPGPQNCFLQSLSDDSKEWYIVFSKKATFEFFPSISQQKALLVSKEVDEGRSVYFRTHKLVNVDRLMPHQELSYQVQHIYAKAIWRSWTMKSIQVLYYFFHLMDHLLDWPPTKLAVPGLKQTNTIATWLQPVFNSTYNRPHSALTSFYRRQFAQIAEMVRSTSTMAATEPAAAKLLQKAGCTTTISGFIVSAVMARYVEVVETFDEATEWVID